MLVRYTDGDSSELPKRLVNQNLWLVTSTRKTPLLSYSIRITIDEAIQVTDDNLCKHTYITTMTSIALECLLLFSCIHAFWRTTVFVRIEARCHRKSDSPTLWYPRIEISRIFGIRILRICGIPDGIPSRNLAPLVFNIFDELRRFDRRLATMHFATSTLL